MEYSANDGETSIFQLFRLKPVDGRLKFIVVDVNVTAWGGEWFDNKSRQPQRTILVRFTERRIGTVVVPVRELTLIA